MQVQRVALTQYHAYGTSIISLFIVTALHINTMLMPKSIAITSIRFAKLTENWCIARTERDGTRAETRFRFSPKRTSPFKSVGVSVQSTVGSRGVRISFSDSGYTTFGGGVRVLATHCICQFPLHFPSRASPCATRFRTISTVHLDIIKVFIYQLMH